MEMRAIRLTVLLRGALTLLGAPLLLAPRPAAADQPVQVQLYLAGKDVTAAHTTDRVRFVPHVSRGISAGSAEIDCLVKQVCTIPPGAYSVELEAKDVIVQTRPQLIVEPADTDPLFVRLYLMPAAHVEVPGIPQGGKLQALDESAATLYSKLSLGGTTRLRIPVGPVILCAYDARTQPLGCWPVRARAGEVVRLGPSPGLARGHGQLLLGFKYSPDGPVHDISVTLKVGDSQIRPDNVVTAHRDRYFAVWYDVPSGRGTIELTSRYWTVAAPVDIAIPDRGTTIQWAIPVIRRPTLRARFLSPERLGPGDVEMDVLACKANVDRDAPPIVSSCTSTASQRGAADGTFVFADLAPGPYALRWKKPPLQAVRWVDLTDGQSRDEAIGIELSEVRGRVIRRGSEYRARLSFLSPNEEIRTQTRTDERGEYELVLAQRGSYFVSIMGDDGRSYSKTCEVTGEGVESRCDFDVPANVVTVQVRTADGSAVPDGATVSYWVRGASPPNEERDYGLGLHLGRDASLVLPPLPNGVLSVEVRAEGYRVATGEPLSVSDDLGTKDLVVLLRKGSGVRFTVLEPSGQPAARARIWSGDYGVIADSAGVAHFDNPLSAGSPLVGFDQSGRMFFTRYGGNQEEVLAIPPSSPAFVVRFQHPDGSPVPRSAVYVAVDGVLDSKRFLDQSVWAGGDSFAGPDGRQRVSGLPALGLLTIFPVGRADLAVQRSLPILDEITFTLPR